MSAHSESCSGSASLCEALFRALAAKVPSLRRSESQRWCGLYRETRSRFAYVAHFKRDTRIEIWCRGDPSDLAAARIGYRPRDEIKGGWEEEFPGRFEITNAQAVEAAAEALYRFSYPAS